MCKTRNRHRGRISDRALDGRHGDQVEDCQQRLTARFLNEPSTRTTTPVENSSRFLPVNQSVSGPTKPDVLGNQSVVLPERSFFSENRPHTSTDERQKRKKPWSWKQTFSSTDSGNWKMHFRSEVARGSNRPTQAMPWMSEIERAKIWDFETIDSKIASAREFSQKTENLS